MQVQERDFRTTVDRYLQLHDPLSGGDVSARKESYAEMVTGYYDLVTDIFEYGWGESFHFAPRFRNEGFAASISRHQHFLAARMGLRPGIRAIDVGCGIGGPMRGVARFSGCNVLGINNNVYQIGKAIEKNREAGLDHLCDLLETDFMNMPIEDGAMNAAYAFEATCHAPDKTALFQEIHRVLEPGGLFGAYEWCLTDLFDENNSDHQRIKRFIMEGDGLPDIWTIEATKQCLRDAGFEIVEVEDRALSSDPETPWYLPMTPRERSFTGLRRTKLGRRLTWIAMTAMERAKMVPPGTRAVSTFLHRGADALVEGGETGIFTPMLWFLARKPK